MAKTPRKPVKAAKTEKQPVPAKKVKKAVGVERLDPGDQKTYAANDDDIDVALHRCNSHLKDFGDTGVALVVVKLLKDYYLSYGVPKLSKKVRVVG